MLHLISIAGLPQNFLDRMAAGDDVMLLQAAVWSAMTGHQDNAKIMRLLSRPSQVYVLQEWLTVNGIEKHLVFPEVRIINYAGLVELTVKNPVNYTWC